jgi:hypothetical protein
VPVWDELGDPIAPPTPPAGSGTAASVSGGAEQQQEQQQQEQQQQSGGKEDAPRPPVSWPCTPQEAVVAMGIDSFVSGGFLGCSWV